MRKLILALFAVALVAPSVSAQVRVKGYTRSDGTYVAPHYRSSPNSTTQDNYSTRGNVNPYTGQPGTRDPDRSSSSTGNSSTNAPRCTYYCPR
jgi:opacity protein-like surface antigen